MSFCFALGHCTVAAQSHDGQSRVGGFLAHLALKVWRATAVEAGCIFGLWRWGGPVADALSKCLKFLIQPALPQAGQLPACPLSCPHSGAVAAWGPRWLAQRGVTQTWAGGLLSLFSFFFFFLFVFLFFLPFLCVLFCSNAWLSISQAEANRSLLCKLFISQNVARQSQTPVKQPQMWLKAEWKNSFITLPWREHSHS